jgi:transposase
VREHQVEEVCCPRCQQVSAGSFPAEVEAPGKSGPNLRTLAVYLHQYQLVPLARTCELLSDLCDCQLSEGTLTAWVECAAQTLEPTVERIADWISASRLQHGDETGIRVKGKLRLPARQQYPVADPPGLARQARYAGVGSDRHLAPLSWAKHA